MNVGGQCNSHKLVCSKDIFDIVYPVNHHLEFTYSTSNSKLVNIVLRIDLFILFTLLA